MEKNLSDIKMKRDALHKHLHLFEHETIPEYALKRLIEIPDGTHFTYHGYEVIMTSKLKKEVTLALTFKRIHK